MCVRLLRPTPLFCQCIYASAHFFQTVRLYDVVTNEQKVKFDHRAAVLACCFGENEHVYSGGLDTSVRQYVTFVVILSTYRTLSCRLELNTEKINNLGQHSDSISSMNYSRESSRIILTIHMFVCSPLPRHADHWFMGSYRSLLGSPSVYCTTILS